MRSVVLSTFKVGSRLCYRAVQVEICKSFNYCFIAVPSRGNALKTDFVNSMFKGKTETALVSQKVRNSK